MPRGWFKKKRNYPELAIHIAIASYLNAVLPKEVEFFHPANGAKVDKAEAAKLKAMGVKAGVADILVFWRATIQVGTVSYAVLMGGAIEVKSAAGVLSPAQKAWRDGWTAKGGLWAVARSIDDVRKALKDWGIQTNESH